MKKKELWERLAAYQFENLVPPALMDRIRQTFGGAHASTKAFATKLAKKHNWTVEFALVAVEEYKKFVFLGLVSEKNVTPPAVIDLVWHQHILFSKGYRYFCDEVLCRDFDHKPELVKDDTQSEMFEEQYFDTLALYEQEFGYAPPPEIWGGAKFEAPPHYREKKKIRTRFGDDDSPLQDLIDDLPDILDNIPDMQPAAEPEVREESHAIAAHTYEHSHSHSDADSSHSHSDAGGGHSHSCSSHSCSSCSSSSCGGSSCGGGGD